MRQISLTVLTLGLAASGFGQTGRTYSSPGGFGNILYPGTGHAPNAPVTSVSGYRGGYGYPAYAPRANHPNHGRTAVVPYPVIVGGGYGYPGYGYGYDSGAVPEGYQDQGGQVYTSNGVPSVVINQTFIPDRATPVIREYGMDAPPQEQSGMRTYEGLRTQPQPDPSARRASDQPTLYLIAFKDHRIVPALGYWIEGGNLHYVSAEHSLNQASLDLIDRDLSQQLNDERHVEFRLPKAQ